MSYSTLNSSLYAVGKAVTRQLFSTLKNNQDDLQTRVLSVEAATNKIVLFNGTISAAATFDTYTNLTVHRAQSDIDITDVKVGIFNKGSISSGTLQIDIQKASSLDFSSSASIFSTKPSLDLSTASSYDESSNAVISGASISEGECVRIDITSIPSGLGSFFIYVIGEPT
jgi:hypothetical protein